MPKQKKRKVLVPVENKVVAPAYEITIKLGETVLSGSGKTMLEALSSIPTPVKIFTKGTVVAKNEDRRMQTTLQPVRVKRLFYPLSRKIIAKQLEVLLK